MYYRVHLLVGLLFCCALLCVSAAATTGSQHAHAHANKERLQDGAYSPRDRSHYGAEGEHDSAFDHEAVIGSVKETDEYDQLSPEESKNRLLKLVRKMDRNGDGNVDRDELKSWILRSFKMLSNEEAEERFEEVDADRDGKVTWSEYISETYGVRDFDEDNQLNEDEVKLVGEDKGMFAAADSNSDGVLDGGEFVSFTHPEEHPKMLPLLVKQTMDSKDTNGDEALDIKEYIGKRGEDKDAEWLRDEQEKFQDLDLDKNGLLQGNEIVDWLVPSNEEIAEEETDHLFASADDDQDDRLTYDEVLQHHDVFAGSDATDYGEHLHNIDKVAHQEL